MELFRALRVQRQELVTLVGAGGKTGAMFRLGDELTGRGWRVVLTTSTHLGADQINRARHTILQPGDQLTDQLLTHSPTLLISGIDPQIDKALGLEPDTIDRMLPILGVDAVINEADGARSLPFKAPADHEPVIPSETTLVVPVVGIDVLGQLLRASHVHRPERVAALTGAELDQPVTAATVAGVLTHPQGGLKGIPTRARVVALINKVQTDGERAVAEALAQRLLRAPRIDAVAIGAVQAADPIWRVKSRVAAVVLAAGESRRFGRLKQLEPWGEGTLLTHAVDVALAAPVRPVVVVLGCRADACRAALGRRPVTVVVNPRWAEGQSTSMQAGLAALPDHVGGALFHLVDLPGVTPAVLAAVIERHAATLAPVVWPEYQGQRGNPVLFDRAVLPQLSAVSGDVGGKPVLARYAQAGQAARVAVQTPGILLDVDVPDDLAQVQPPTPPFDA